MQTYKLVKHHADSSGCRILLVPECFVIKLVCCVLPLWGRGRRHYSYKKDHLWQKGYANC